MNLLVDSGNSRLKWAAMQDGGLVTGRALDNRQITKHELVETWKKLNAS